jgi:hypothetical protein
VGLGYVQPGFSLVVREKGARDMAKKKAKKKAAKKAAKAEAKAARTAEKKTSALKKVATGAQSEATPSPPKRSSRREAGQAATKHPAAATEPAPAASQAPQ